MQEYVSKYGKILLFIVGGLVAMYLMIYIFTPKPEIPLEYKHALDSLDRANAELVAKQKQIDSIISTYKHQVDSIDSAIKNLDVKKTEVHKHYHVLGEKVDKFTPTQVDSFFKTRYNY